MASAQASQPAWPARILAQPETDSMLLDVYRVAGPTAIRALLRNLHDPQAIVTIHSARRHQDYVVGRLVHAEPRTIELGFEPEPAERLSTLGDDLIVVGMLDRVKIQFLVSAARMLRAASAPNRLRLPLPWVAWRFQRRDAVRVPAPLGVAIVCRIPHGDAQGPATGVLDLSNTGIGLAWPMQRATPRIGQAWPGARLSIGSQATITVDLRVCHVSERAIDAAGTVLRVGCELIAAHPQDASQLQTALAELSRDTGSASPRARASEARGAPLHS